MRLYQAFRITGQANAIIYDEGLKSTDTEPKSLKKVHIQCDSQASTDDNNIQGYHERAKVFDAPAKLFPVETVSATPTNYATPKLQSLNVELDIPKGEAFKVALKCAATAINIRGVYEYEIIT